jgi:small-conductance mechanosensitive channel
MDFPLVALIAVNSAFTAFILWLIAYYLLRKSQQKLEERLRVLEKLEGQELTRFLESERGKNFLDRFGQRPAHPLRVVVATTALGVILIFVGLAFLSCVWLNVWDDVETFWVPGLLCSLGGLGVLAAATVSSWLSRRWGLIPSEQAES